MSIYSKENNKNTTGMLLIDKYGLPIEKSGSLDKQQTGLISSIMKNATRLNALLL